MNTSNICGYLLTKEKKIRQKCAELRKRINETEESNEIAVLALSRTRNAIRRLRLQHAILLERILETVFEPNDEDLLTQPALPSFLKDSVNVKKLALFRAQKDRESREGDDLASQEISENTNKESTDTQGISNSVLHTSMSQENEQSLNEDNSAQKDDRPTASSHNSTLKSSEVQSNDVQSSFVSKETES